MSAQVLLSTLERMLIELRGESADRPDLRAAHRIDNLRSKALCAAAEILTTRGQDKLSLKNIADHAGIGIASIYHYFACKDDLLTSLGVQGFDDLRREMARARASPLYSSPMTAATQAYLLFAESHPQLLSLMFSERLMVRSEALRDAEQVAMRSYCEAVEADDLLPSRHRFNVGRALWAMGRGIAGTAASRPDRKIPPDAFAGLLAGASYLINHHD